MGGKGQKRREKNYRAAHGGYAPLPPPPNPTDLDALPSKLRRIMGLNKNTTTSSPSSTDKDQPQRNNNKKRNRDAAAASETPTPKFDTKFNGEKLITPKNEFVDEDGRDKKKKKRKKKQITDLRFETTDNPHCSGGSVKRRERKKKYLEAKKNKHKKGKTTEDGLDFPGHEKIKFGEVVDAPPKLSALPKGLKPLHDASHERLRLQAIEAYRNRKGWASRPGIQLPPNPITPNSSV